MFKQANDTGYYANQEGRMTAPAKGARSFLFPNKKGAM